MTLPSFAPLWSVQYSRMVLPSPMTSRLGVSGHELILRRRAEDGPVADRVVPAEHHGARENGVGLDDAPGSDDGRPFDNDAGADLDIRGQGGGPVHDGGGVDQRMRASL